MSSETDSNCRQGWFLIVANQVEKYFKYLQSAEPTQSSIHTGYDVLKREVELIRSGYYGQGLTANSLPTDASKDALKQGFMEWLTEQIAEGALTAEEETALLGLPEFDIMNPPASIKDAVNEYIVALLRSQDPELQQAKRCAQLFFRIEANTKKATLLPGVNIDVNREMANKNITKEGFTQWLRKKAEEGTLSDENKASLEVFRKEAREELQKTTPGADQVKQG